jgi:hypothetical protein
MDHFEKSGRLIYDFLSKKTPDKLPGVKQPSTTNRFYNPKKNYEV